MSKKNLFWVISLLLTGGLLVVTALPVSYRVLAVVILSSLSFVLTILALRRDLAGIEFLTLTTLPTLFTLGMAGILYYFPNFSHFFRFLFSLIFSFFFYVTLLCENIFNVAGERSLPLLRASYTAAFLVTLFTVFPLYTVVFKTNPSFLMGVLLITALTFALTFQSLWTIFLPKPFDDRAFWGSVVVTLMMVEALSVFSFFPMESFFKALGLSTVYYIVLGFAHHYFRKTLKTKVYLEYFLIGFIVFLIISLN